MGQLLLILEKASIPFSAFPSFNSKRYQVSYKTLPSLPLAYWPNGVPCHLINHWLVKKSLISTGRQSARTRAFKLTQLIRYCFDVGIDFFEMNDAHLEKFATVLTSETKLDRHGMPTEKRLNNQTLQIQLEALYFLQWISENYPLPYHGKLVGLESDSPRITIELRESLKGREPTIWHASLVEPVAPLNDKFPMPDRYINQLQNEVFRRHDISRLPPKSKLKLVNDDFLFRATNKYIYDRRMFSIRMFKNFGLRPEELYDLSLDRNSEITKSLTLYIPTKKRRFKKAPTRRIKIGLVMATSINNYFKSRTTYIDFLTSKGITVADPNCVYIGEHGKRIKKESLTKEFDRLADSAGLKDVKACLSMFRHRFITREIHASLILKFKTNKKLKSKLTEQLRDDICREVAQKTGHGDYRSLFTYFHEEYSLLTKQPHYDKCVELKQRIDELKDTMADVRFLESEHSRKSTKSIIAELEASLTTMEETLYALREDGELDEDDMDTD
ncbi:hypothetical protein RYB01_23580 [Pseudomonas syringae]|nr:hypothetical protein [Pseudomonas syringae]